MVRVGASLYDVTTWWCVSCSLIMAVPFCGRDLCECCWRMGGGRHDRVSRRQVSHRDDHLAPRPPALDVGHGVLRRLEGEDPVEDRPDGAGVDEGGDRAKLLAAGLHEQERVPHAASPGPQPGPGAEQHRREADDGIRADLPGEAGVGRASDADGDAAWSEHAEGLSSVCPPRGGGGGGWW